MKNAYLSLALAVTIPPSLLWLSNHLTHGSYLMRRFMCKKACACESNALSSNSSDPVAPALAALKEHFGDKVAIGVIDNSGKPGEAVYTDQLHHYIEAASKWTEAKTQEAMNAELERLHGEGKVPEDIYAVAKRGKETPHLAGGSASERPAESGEHGQGQGSDVLAEAKPATSVQRGPVADLKLDPKRFQYKLNTDSAGVTGLLKGLKWNEDLSGLVNVWRGPADGKTYVVNGHHRVQLARENGVPDIHVRYIKAADASAARATGALQNIAEGRGTCRQSAVRAMNLCSSPRERGETRISRRLADFSLDLIVDALA